MLLIFDIVKFIGYLCVAYAATSYWIPNQYSFLWWVVFILLLPLPAKASSVRIRGG